MQGIVITHSTVTVEIKAFILDARKTCKIWAQNQGLLSISQCGWSFCQWPAPTVTRGFLPGMSGRSLYIVRKGHFTIQHLVSLISGENGGHICLPNRKSKFLLIAPLGLTGFFFKFLIIAHSILSPVVFLTIPLSISFPAIYGNNNKTCLTGFPHYAQINRNISRVIP